MAKLSLTPEPRFKAVVDIHGAGGHVLPVEFVFRHMTKNAVEAFVATGKDRSDMDTIMEIVEGWTNVDAEFGRESLEQLFQNYYHAPAEIARGWYERLMHGGTGRKEAGNG